jgi:hypothetical protein
MAGTGDTVAEVGTESAMAQLVETLGLFVLHCDSSSSPFRLSLMLPFLLTCYVLVFGFYFHIIVAAFVAALTVGVVVNGLVDVAVSVVMV